MTVWRLFWDITAVVVGLYLGYKGFLLSGRTIPAFGYFPVGLIIGLIVLGLTAVVIHLIEGLIATLIYKLFKVKLEEGLPFD